MTRWSVAMALVLGVSSGCSVAGCERNTTTPAKVSTTPTSSTPTSSTASTSSTRGALPIEGFPRQEKPELVKGQLALGADPFSLKRAFESQAKDQLVTLSLTNYLVVEPGPWASRVERTSDALIPNALLIPLPRDEAVKAGDMVLTWWQRGAGMHRAIVIEGGSPTEPMVRYVDLADSVEPSQATMKLAPNSYRKLDKPREPGVSVAFRFAGRVRYGTLLKEAEGKSLVLEGGLKLRALDSKRVMPLPIKPDLQAGDEVYAARLSRFYPGKVESIDAVAGQIKVRYNLGGSDKVEAFPFGDVTTTLPEP